jgi:hypothetical protein
VATSVREQREHRREHAAEFVAADVVRRTPWQLFWLRFRRDRVALAALAFIALLILVAILAGPITRGGASSRRAVPARARPELRDPTGPLSSFRFGVDKVGEDVFSRVLYGARVSLEVSGPTSAGSSAARSSRCARRSSSRRPVPPAPATGRSSSARSCRPRCTDGRLLDARHPAEHPARSGVSFLGVGINPPQARASPAYVYS